MGSLPDFCFWWVSHPDAEAGARTDNVTKEKQEGCHEGVVDYVAGGDNRDGGGGVWEESHALAGARIDNFIWSVGQWAGGDAGADDRGGWVTHRRCR